MGFISENTINKIKQRLSIIDVVSDYVRLKKSGRNYVGLCPFHIEKTPSFFVNEEKGVYHCFGCGASGNMFNFIMQIENVSFPESIKILAKKADIEIEYKEGKFTAINKEKEIIYKINERAMFIYHYYLKEREEAHIAREFLKKRGITDQMIETFNLGYAPAEQNRIYQILTEEKYTEPMILKTGLIIPSTRGEGYFDRFRNRIIFPIIDVNDKIIGFGGRIIEDNPNLPKYMNTPETEVFQKRNNLFGLNVARNYIREKRQAIVVEGYFDVISLFQADIKNVVAPLGTALTEEQVLLLKRYADEIIILFDSDKAGNKATIRSIALLLKTNLKIRVVELPVDYDPDLYVRKYGGENLLKLIDNAPSFLKFVIKNALNKFDRNTSEGKASILQEIFPVLAMIQDEILKDDVLRFLGEKLKIADNIIRREFVNYLKKGKIDKIRIPDSSRKINALSYAERAISIIVLEYPEYADVIFKNIEPKDFVDEIAKKTFEIIFNYYCEHHNILIDEIFNLIADDNIKSFIAQELLSSKYKDNIEKQLNDYIFKIKLNKIETKLKELKEKIKTQQDFISIKNIEEEIQGLYLDKEKLLKNKNNLIKLEV